MEVNSPAADPLYVRRIAVTVAVAVFAGLLSFAAPAAADDPAFVDWTSLLPGLTTSYEPSSANDCAAGRSSCVKSTIREMQRRFDPMAQACDPNATFTTRLTSPLHDDSRLTTAFCVVDGRAT